MTPTPLLTTHGLGVRFGGLAAVSDLTFEVATGAIHAIIGPNGAGKTTAFNLISGLVAPTCGTITLNGHALDGLPTWARAKLGLARTFQNIRLFGEMSVLENVMTGAHGRHRPALPQILLRTPGFRQHERQARDQALAMLEIVGLAGAAHRPAGDLPYGDQRRLEIARALAAAPQLLLLDEPAAGMNPSEKLALARLFQTLRGMGVTLLLVEHDMPFVMDLCDQITVLNFGAKIAEGPPDMVRRDPLVIEAYLGAKVAQKLGA